MPPFTEARADDLRNVLRTLTKTAKVVGQNEIAREIEVPPGKIYTFLDDHQPRNDEILYRLLEHLVHHEGRYRQVLQPYPEAAQQFDALVGPKDWPHSPLNWLFQYFAYVRALDPAQSKALSKSLRGHYRLYQRSGSDVVLCSTMYIFGYSAKQKTPYFVRALIEKDGSLRVSRGNILALDRDLIFMGLVERPDADRFEKLTRPPKNSAGVAAEYLIQESQWIGMEMLVFRNPEQGGFDDCTGIAFSRSAEAEAYDFSKVVLVREQSGRQFKLKAPAVYANAQLQEESEAVAKLLPLERLGLADGLPGMLRFQMPD